MHAYRVARYGDPGPVGRKEPKDRYQYDSGYVLVRVGHGRGRNALRYEHDVLMEELLGRPLLPGETVHHCNTVRDDNRTGGPLDANFRSGNLQLWTKSQPAGGRVVDKIAWAVELLEQYAPELLNQKPTQLRLA